MSREYYVVLEHTKESGGQAGIRVIRCYIDKEDFDKNGRPFLSVSSILAEGITEKEAHDLFSQTPEICRLTSAIEKIFKHVPNGGTPDRNTVSREINAAKRRIIEDRQYRQENDLQLDEGSFAFVNIKGSGNKTMNDAFGFLDINFYTNTGAIVDLEFATNRLILYLHD